jgi:hypothetical protein
VPCQSVEWCIVAYPLRNVKSSTYHILICGCGSTPDQFQFYLSIGDRCTRRCQWKGRIRTMGLIFRSIHNPTHLRRRIPLARGHGPSTINSVDHALHVDRLHASHTHELQRLPVSLALLTLGEYHTSNLPPVRLSFYSGYDKQSKNFSIASVCVLDFYTWLVSRHYRFPKDPVN